MVNDYPKIKNQNKNTCRPQFIWKAFFIFIFILVVMMITLTLINLYDNHYSKTLLPKRFILNTMQFIQIGDK